MATTWGDALRNVTMLTYQRRNMALISSAFEAFREQLDEHYDRRERLIKVNRDVSAASKKVIFLLQRILNEPSDDDRALSLRAATEARNKLAEVHAMLRRTAHELVGPDFWRYAHCISSGLQEYIEALSFVHYVEYGGLVSYERAQANLCDDTGHPLFPLPLSDYVLGICDLTGELMRLAISSISKPNGFMKASQISLFVRGCKADFETLTPYVDDLHKKQVVTTQSLRKVEEAAYAIAIRSSEYELSPSMLDHIVSQVTSEGAELLKEPDTSSRSEMPGK
ncbi:Translin [Russula earlei]|uniref:Translin n=1 Tax=Russula earlei TaxID=71964 RepID=A0ACC0ULU9_9AGAM|nr:Translin [Russula earlei]